MYEVVIDEDILVVFGIVGVGWVDGEVGDGEWVGGCFKLMCCFEEVVVENVGDVLGVVGWC